MPRAISRGDFDAQWNDDGHHVLHVLLTGEREGYYEDYADDRAERAGALPGGRLHLSGRAVAHRGGKPRGTPSGDLPPTAFVLFLQNHDQIGNRAFGERLTTLADPRRLKPPSRCSSCARRSPCCSWARSTAARRHFCSSPTTMRTLPMRSATARRREFASFAQFADRSVVGKHPGPECGRNLRSLGAVTTGATLAVHARTLSPPPRPSARLKSCRALRVRARSRRWPSPGAVIARWRLGDGSF